MTNHENKTTRLASNSQGTMPLGLITAVFQFFAIMVSVVGISMIDNFYYQLTCGIFLSVLFSALGGLGANRFSGLIREIIAEMSATSFDKPDIHLPETGIRELKLLEECFHLMNQEISKQIFTLKENERRYRGFIDNSPDIFYRTDLEGHVTFVSPSVTKHTGYTPEEAIGKNLAKMGYENPAHREVFLDTLKQHGTVENFESLQKRKDGSFWWASTNAQWYKNMNGEIIGVVGVTRDVTPYKIAEKAVMSNEQKFRSIFESSPVGLIHIDGDGIITALNDQLCRILGTTQDMLLGKNVLKLVENQEVVFALEKALTGEKTGYEGVYESVTGGVSTPVRATYSPIFSPEGMVSGLIGITEDMSDQLKHEKEKRSLEIQLQQTYKMEAIGTLAGGIAHDFNNILTPLVGYAQLLKYQLSADHPFQTNVNTMLSCALRAKDLVQQILTFSRKTASEKIPLQLQPIIKESLKLMRSSIPSNIEIQTDIDPDCGWINADPTKIHQVIINLSTNAYHAMEMAGGILAVTLKQEPVKNVTNENGEESTDTCVHLMITDNGTGMEKEILDKIFDPYFTTKPSGKGTGLGLSVVHGIVKECGGDIRIESEVGKGTDIHICFPVIKNHSEVKSEKKRPLPTGTERVLLIDDEDVVAGLQQQMLEQLGYQVTLQTDSMAGLENFRNNEGQFDVIITDMTMPKLTGLQLTQEIRKINENIPIILCTGYSDQINDLTLKSEKIQGYLMKPIVLRDLAEVVRNTIDMSRQAHSIS